jgi:hypothetical protein
VADEATRPPFRAVYKADREAPLPALSDEQARLVAAIEEALPDGPEEWVGLWKRHEEDDGWWVEIRPGPLARWMAPRIFAALTTTDHPDVRAGLALERLRGALPDGTYAQLLFGGPFGRALVSFGGNADLVDQGWDADTIEEAADKARAALSATSEPT